MLDVQQLNKHFGEHQVLCDVSFSADPGEIVVIRGASGAGKTTLIRCICNLEEPDSGSIAIDNIAWLERIGKRKQADLHQDRVGLVFQGYHLFPHLSVLDNLTVAVRSKRLLSDSDAKAKAYATLERLGIHDKAQQYPHQLSGGQRQRVAIARTIMMSPRILCFDEPTSALDRKSTDGVAEIIRSLAKDGMLILIITHDHEFADQIATRQLYMQDARLYHSEKELPIA